jgi:hypothetical protein
MTLKTVTMLKCIIAKLLTVLTVDVYLLVSDDGVELQEVTSA